MATFEELSTYVNELKEPNKSIVLSLLKDFCYLEAELNKLQGLPRYVVDPKNPRLQKKLAVHDILKDLQSQKNDIATKILRSLDTELTEDSPLAKLLSRFEK